METKLTLELLHWRRGSFADGELFRQSVAQFSPQRLGGKPGPLVVARANGDEHSVFERREIAALPELELLLGVAGKIVMARELD